MGKYLSDLVWEEISKDLLQINKRSINHLDKNGKVY